MAAILEGDTELSTTAPLSKAQTVAIVRHVQGEVRNVEFAANETHKNLQHATNHLQKLKEEQVATHSEVHDLQVGLSEANIVIGKVQSQVGRIFDAVAALQISSENSKDQIMQLAENKSMTDTQLASMTKEMEQEKKNLWMLQQILETKINDDVKALGTNLDNLRLSVDHLRAEQRATSEAERQDRESLREAHMNIDAVMNEVKKANTVTNIIENRLASTAKGVQQNWNKCEELTQNSLRLQESHMVMKDRISDAEGLIKQVNDAGQDTSHRVDDLVRQFERQNDRLAEALRALEDQGSGAEEMKHQIIGLKQAGDGTNRRLNSVQAELREVSDTAFAVKAGLKEQSSILLPNIHADSNEVVAASARHGSLLMTSPAGGRPQAKSSPRKAMNRIPAASQTWT